MKKFNIAILLLLFVGMYNLSAQDAEDEMESKTITVKVTPSAEARGVLNFEGAEQKKGNTIATSGDSEGRIKAEADYNGIVGAVVEFEGDLGSATAKGDTPNIGFGDNAYIYVHALEAFGLLDKSVLDVYLQGGRFEVGFQNAQYAGGDDWLKDVDAIGRDNRINMQLDVKIMDMITVRTGLSFSPFDDKDFGNDLGFGILFEKAFGDHKFIASLGYVVNSTDNIASYGSDPGNDVTVPQTVTDYSDPGNRFRKTYKDFDQFGISLAYQGTFGQMVLLPFVNFRAAGLINKPERLAYENGQLSWNAGVKFSYKDATNTYDLIGAGLDFDGVANRENHNYYSNGVHEYNNGFGIVRDTGLKNYPGELQNTTTGVDPEDDLNMGLQGFQIKVWSDGLRSIMGDNYLKAWLKLRFETWVPDRNVYDASIYDIERTSALQKFGIGVEQYFVNKDNASVSLFAELTIENMAPFKRVRPITTSYYSYADDVFAVSEENSVKTYFEFGLKASFTGIITAEMQ